MKSILPVLGFALTATLGHAQVSVSQPTVSATQALDAGSAPFRRVATFPVFQNTSVDIDTVAEIVAATDDGMTLVYTDGVAQKLGFIDISNPAAPQPAGAMDLPGEPTSVTVRGPHALVCVNNSANFINTAGDLLVVDIATQTIVTTIALGGQPDAIALSPDKRFAAIAIENERDEDLGDGYPPQAPAGFLQIVDCFGAPSAWATRQVSLVGLSTLYPTDPEPEFVDINARNIAVVTMQENNYVALVNLVTGQVIGGFDCGAIDLDLVDATEDDLINQVESLKGVLREPDAVTWTSTTTFVTANEGDLDGGSRGFTTWRVGGTALFDTGNTLEHHIARVGHYPESRSENKGNEAEGVDYGQFGTDRFFFVASERSNTVSVYQIPGNGPAAEANPFLRQVLSTGVGPEGVLAIPSRNLLVVAAEEDNRGDKIRSSITIFERSAAANYPTVISASRANGTPIPWSALSGLDVNPNNASQLFTVHDSYYRQSRFFTMSAVGSPMLVRAETVIVDVAGKLKSALDALKASLPASAVADFDVDAIVETDGTVNLDLEGITALEDGTLWVVSEGTGNLASGVSDPSDRPFESPNLALHLDAAGAILDVVLLPQAVIENQLRFGFEGCAVQDGALFVVFQREWKKAGDSTGFVRVGRYDLTTQTWSFAHYGIDTPTSPNGGWVGLSDLVALGNGQFAVVERDDQAGTDATIKRIYTFDVTGVTFLDETQVASFPVLSKTLKLDILAAGVYAPFGCSIPEKIEGLTVLPNGTALIVNDNDGVDDNNGETLMVQLPGLF